MIPALRPPGARRDAGFTLLEIVVALVVLGILLVTLTRGVQFGLAAFDRQDHMVETGGRLEAVDRTLRRLVEQLDPGTGSDGNSVVGAPHAMAFRSPIRIEAGPDGGSLSDLRLSVDAGHRLLLSWVPHRHVIATGPGPAPHQETLLEHVERLELSYYGGGGWHTQWREPAPPALIRIRIVFPDGDPRHWPDIVAAPARESLTG